MLVLWIVRRNDVLFSPTLPSTIQLLFELYNNKIDITGYYKHKLKSAEHFICAIADMINNFPVVWSSLCLFKLESYVDLAVLIKLVCLVLTFVILLGSVMFGWLVTSPVNLVTQSDITLSVEPTINKTDKVKRTIIIITG